jgi:tetratricopeptide (TPR) repeat protein
MTEEIIHDGQHEVRRLVTEGVHLGQQGRFTDAARICEHARDTARALGFRDEEMQALLTLSACAMVAGDQESAGRHLNRVHLLALELGDDRALAKCALNQGSLAMKRDPAMAIRHYREAAVAFERTGDPLGAAQCLANTGSVYWQMGALRTAFTYIHQARDAFATTGHREELANSLLNLGGVLTDIAEAGLEAPGPVQANAKRLYEEALRIAAEIRSPYHYGRALDLLGLLRRVQGHAEEAVKLHELACEHFTAAGARSTLSSALLHLGSAYQLIPGKEEEALEAYARCRALKASLGDTAGIARVCHGEGVLLITLGRFGDGRERLGEAIRLHGAAGGVIADAELIASDRQEVEKSWQEYLFATARLIAAGALLGTTLLNERERREGQVLLAELHGEIPYAGNSGSSPLEQVRRRVKLRERVANAGLRRAELRAALNDGRMREEEFAQEIQKVVHDGAEAVFAMHHEAPDLTTIRRPGAAHKGDTSLQADTTALTIVHLSDFPHRESLVLGVVRAGTESLHPHPLPPEERKEIYTAQNRLRFAFANRRPKMAEAEAALGTLSCLLGNALARSGVLDALSGAEGDVLLLLDSEWNLMPWEAAACYGMFLGTRYRLVRIFGTSLLHLPGTRKELELKRRERPSASIFCPDPDGLPGSLEEVERVVAALESAGWDPHPYVGRRATPARFVATLRRSRNQIIHFSGHSLFHPTDALLSAIVLHPGGSAKHSAGRLTALEIQSLGQTGTSPLVYLSSCESGIADVRGGNEAFGLSRALLLAGAGSLVLANWPVWDSSAPDTAGAFYAAFLQGRSPGEALRSARCEVAQRTANGEYSDGGDLVHWAPFAVYGRAAYEAQLRATA